MKIAHALILSAVLAISGSGALLLAQDKPADKAPTTAPARRTAAAARVPRVTGNYAKMESLTAEQKTQIAAFHRANLEEKRKLDLKEEMDIDAILTPEQKKELQTIKDDAVAKRKGAPDPATQPAE